MSDGVQSVEGTFEQLPPILGGFGRAPEYRFDAANAAYREFLGRDDVIGRSAPDLFPEWIGQQVFEAVDRVVASGQSETVSAWGVQAQEPPAEEQDEIYVDMVVTPRRDDSGTVNGVTVHAMPVVDGAGARRAEHRRTLRAERRYEALDYATCGHLPPLVVRPDGHARFLPPSRSGPLGTGSTPTTLHGVLDVGDVAFFYTDGLVERPGQDLRAGMDALVSVMRNAVVDQSLPVEAPATAAERACVQPRRRFPPGARPR